MGEGSSGGRFRTPRPRLSAGLALNPHGAERPRRTARPLRAALLVACGYLAIGLAYIAFSGSIAVRFARDKAHLEQIEAYKGYGFVLVTAAALFFVLWALLRRLSLYVTEIERQEQALVESESRSMAMIVAASIGHDVKNALAIARLSLDELEYTSQLRETHGEVLFRIDKVHDDLHEMADRLQEGLRENGHGHCAPHDVAKEVFETLEVVRRARVLQACRIRADLEGPVLAPLSPGLLRRTLINLLLNAAQATHEEGEILVRLRRREGQVVLEVHDDGPGLPEELTRSGPKPFQSTKAEGRGLGLMVLKSFSRVHLGEFELGRSEALGGALVRIAWPLVPERELTNAG